MTRGSGWQQGSKNSFLFALGNITRKQFRLSPHARNGHQTHLGSCGMHIGQNDFVAFCSHTHTPPQFTVFDPVFATDNLSAGVLTGETTAAGVDGIYLFDENYILLSNWLHQCE